MKIKALSIVQPAATRIAQGYKTLEVRSWIPALQPGEDLLLIENDRFLREDGDRDPNGRAAAIVKVARAREYTTDDILPACATYWCEGYYSWELSDVRPVRVDRPLAAERGIYEIELTKGELQTLPKSTPIFDETFLQTRFLELLTTNKLLWRAIERSEKLGVSNWAIGAGFLQQTVLNVLHGRPATEGIKDIDWVYFDSSDLSEEAENSVVARVQKALSDIPLPIDVKNQARVHKWYERKFGYSIKPYRDLEDAISTWPTTSTAIAITKRNSKLEVIAPFGLHDLMSMTIRPNKRQITEEIYNAKLERWRRVWPKLSILPWSDPK